jgi:hypothetical protein
MSISSNELIGMEKQAALDLCEQEGVRVRVENEDGEPFMLTMDYIPTRLNLTIQNGKVVRVRHG